MYLLGEAFAKRNDIDFHIIASSKGVRGVRVVERPGATVHYIEERNSSIVPSLLTQPAKISPVMRDIKPDIINSHHDITTAAAYLAECKVVHTVHGITREEVKFLRGRSKIAALLHAQLQQKSIMQADAVTSVAKYGLDANANWIDSPTAVINVPVEDIFWSVPDMRPNKGIMFVGSVGERKNLLALIKAMPIVLQKHPDSVLYVCGGIANTGYKQKLDQISAKDDTSNAIKYLGVVDRHKLVQLLEKSASLVLPSYQETSPGVICQAMAAGRVPVAAPVGGVPEMIEDGETGFLVDSEDFEELAQRLIELFNDPVRAAKMGAAARAVALTRYKADDVADQILKFCSSILGRQ
jgi:glycosyltransferase involved in cell wall biosynthesis